MTSNSEEETSQPRPVSSKGAEISFKEETQLTQETCSEIKTNEKNPDKTASEQNQLDKNPEKIQDQNELNQSEFCTKFSGEENSTPEEQNKETIEPLQHEITTIEEESERDIKNITLDRSEDNRCDSDIENLEENEKNKCVGCLTDVFYCTIWYFRNIKSFIVSCFSRCDWKNCCRGNGSVDSDEPDGNYVYSDLNETFNNEISSNDGINSFDVVNATAASYHDGNLGGYYNSVADVGHNHSAVNVGHSAVDVGHNHSAVDAGHNHTAVDAGHNHSTVDVGVCNSGDDGGFSSGGDFSCDFSGGDGGGDSGGGGYD